MNYVQVYNIVVVQLQNVPLKYVVEQLLYSVQNFGKGTFKTWAVTLFLNFLKMFCFLLFFPLTGKKLNYSLCLYECSGRTYSHLWCVEYVSPLFILYLCLSTSIGVKIAATNIYQVCCFSLSLNITIKRGNKFYIHDCLLSAILQLLLYPVYL